MRTLKYLAVVFGLFTAVPAMAQISIVSGDGQQLVTGQVSAPFVVQVTGSEGGPASGVKVNWVGSPGATTSISNTETFTDASGQTGITAIVGIPGPARIIATLDDGAQVIFNIFAGVQNIANLSPIQVSVGNAIDIACPALAGSEGLNADASDLLNRCSEVVVFADQNPVEAAAALINMATEETSAQGSMATEVSLTQTRNVKSRLLALRGGSTGVDATGLVINTSAGPFALGLAGDGEGPLATSFGNWGLFVNGRISFGEKDATDREVGFDSDGYGLTAGVDYRFTNRFVLGAALGYNSESNDLDGNLGDLDVDGYSFSGYGAYAAESGWYLDGLITLARNELDSRRRINYSIPSLGGGTTVVDQVAIGEPDGDNLAFALSLGKDFISGERRFSPYLRVEHTSVEIDGYTERLSNPTGAGGGLGLVVSDQDIDSLEGVLGARLGWTLSRGWGVLLPQFTAEFIHEFDDDSRVVAARFINDPTSTAFTFATDDPDRNFVTLGASLGFVFANGRSAFVSYESLLGYDDVSQHVITAGGRFEF
ncbi:MAG: autotransporter outer membrane beta-barrel domain-containing protein [Pseudomonadota bacterium]